MLFDVDRRVLQGTCGWSDPSLFACKRFYPLSTANNSKEKLSYYSRRGGFGCVEVDSSTYAILNDVHSQSWIDATPSKFTFHIKAFGALCNGGVEAKMLPAEVRGEHRGWTSLESLGEANSTRLWELFNLSLGPFIRANKLGCVVFQFQTNMDANPTSRAYIEQCARRLRKGVRMAVELRSRQWIAEDAMEDTLSWLNGLRPGGVCLIASDDLECEVYRDRGSSRVLPMCLTAKCCPDFTYIRVHRREGTARLLSAQELQQWRDRIMQLLVETDDVGRPLLQGPIYVLWGTDHEDQGVLNARSLAALLPDHVVLHWATATGSNKGTLTSLWGKRNLSSATSESVGKETDNKKAKRGDGV